MSGIPVAFELHTHCRCRRKRRNTVLADFFKLSVRPAGAVRKYAQPVLGGFFSQAGTSNIQCCVNYYACESRCFLPNFNVSNPVWQRMRNDRHWWLPFLTWQRVWKPRAKCSCSRPPVEQYRSTSPMEFLCWPRTFYGRGGDLCRLLARFYSHFLNAREQCLYILHWGETPIVRILFPSIHIYHILDYDALMISSLMYTMRLPHVS